MSTTIWFSTEATTGVFPWLRRRLAARRTRADDWHESFAFRPVHTDKGVVSMVPVYRRSKADGTYEYRAMTETEEADYVSSDAW